MAGTTDTTRKIGMPDSGFPDPTPTADERIRIVDEDILDLSQVNELQILKLFGGFEGAKEVSGMKYEWMETDQWLLETLVDNNPLAAGGTSLTLTGEAHRYPRGTILQLGTWGDANDPELVWVSAQASADALTVVRNYAGTTAAERVQGARVRVAGFAEVEGTDWTLRMGTTKSFKFNYMTMVKEAVRGSWASQAVALYGTPAGADLNEQAGNALKQAIQRFNNMCLLGMRDEGQGANEPASMGGADFYVTSANGAYVEDLGGNSLELSDIYDMIQDRYDAVGGENVGTTLLTDFWGQRRINSFFEGAVRVELRENAVGMLVSTIRTPIGDIDVVFDRVVRGRSYLLKPDRFEIVRLADPPASVAPPSKLHLGMSGNTNEGDYTEMYLYGVYGLKVKNVETMGIIHSYSQTA